MADNYFNNLGIDEKNRKNLVKNLHRAQSIKHAKLRKMSFNNFRYHE